jgi:transcription termination/antitermination protein NusG
VNWYVVHTYSGQENNIKKHIEMMVERENMQGQIGQILVPFKEEVHISRGKRKTVRKNHFPSYILIEMELDKLTQHLVLSIPGVTNFVGTGNQPQPVRKSEIDRLLGTVDPEDGLGGEIQIPFIVGDSVRIKEGPFKDFVGTVEEIMADKRKLKAMVSVFGRSTPVELGFTQVESVYQ